MGISGLSVLLVCGLILGQLGGVLSVAIRPRYSPILPETPTEAVGSNNTFTAAPCFSSPCPAPPTPSTSSLVYQPPSRPDECPRPQTVGPFANNTDLTVYNVTSVTCYDPDRNPERRISATFYAEAYQAGPPYYRLCQWRREDGYFGQNSRPRNHNAPIFLGERSEGASIFFWCNKNSTEVMRGPLREEFVEVNRKIERECGSLAGGWGTVGMNGTVVGIYGRVKLKKGKEKFTCAEVKDLEK
ncbi:hypothetical protein BJ508DRAFT_327877 [Ascobolus immersus RN42]|uniref:Uncharacterized protein n=1 Tax=Ascobolus immersus RN42 TaxID=1160509 RepID=A0A3N4I6M2_ASCIM|nr:hypothetical protein BJ508DRAFT_327877 [Ascobolus immersus RN42]